MPTNPSTPSEPSRPSDRQQSGQWLQLACETHPEAVEAVSELFRRYVPTGVSIQESVQPTDLAGGWRIDLERPAVVSAFIPLDGRAAAIQQQIEQDLWHIGTILPIYSFHVETLSEQDWAEAWREHFHVHRVGTRTVIKPTWRDYVAQPNDVVIDLDPGMAFGTGLHPTTQMCLAELEQAVKPGASVLDVGTGSAILSIAAVKLGAGSVLACDVDPVAVDVARQNVALNGLQDRVQVALGSLGPSSTLLRDGQQFDLLLANIIADVIVALMPSFFSALMPGGLAILSGIIDTKEESVDQALGEAGFELASREKQGDWLMLAVRRPER
jgi:ribosomal protein L11 methyltransferase